MSFPLVIVNDYGIRPAGPKDACLYCQQKIGSEHKKDCVVIHKIADLTFNFKHNGFIYSLILTEEVVYGWEDSQHFFKYNEGSWCTDNLFDKYADMRVNPHTGFTFEETIKALEDLKQLQDGGCLCYSGLELVQIDIVNPGPLVTLR